MSTGKILKGKALLKRVTAFAPAGSMKDASFEATAKQAQKDGVIIQKALDNWLVITK